MPMLLFFPIIPEKYSAVSIEQNRERNIFWSYNYLITIPWAFYQNLDANSTTVNFIKWDHIFHKIVNKKTTVPNFLRTWVKSEMLFEVYLGNKCFLLPGFESLKTRILHHGGKD
jgi:hypothetical protein